MHKARRETINRALEALEERLAVLKRRGWSEDERRLLSGSARDVEEEVKQVRRRIATIRRLRDGD